MRAVVPSLLFRDKPWQILGLTAALLLLTGGSFGLANQAVSDPNDPPEVKTGQLASPIDASSDVDAPPLEKELGASSDPSQKPDRWQSEVDVFFGEIVGKMAAVIFFDCGTGRLLGTSIPFVVMWLAAGGIFLTIRMGLINLRGFWHAIELIRGDYDNADEPGEVSHFQALTTALSATVGLGNIGGVAVAVGLGGPGAAFWMMVVGLIGMSTKFTECTLGQLYRTIEPDGHVLGGPMRYLKSGIEDLNWGSFGKIFGGSLAGIFAILCIGASFGGGNAYQINQSLAAIQGDISFLKDSPWVYGLVMSVLVGLVIVGGIRSIGAVASRIVPFMCAAYMLAAMYILLVNVTAIPEAMLSIFWGAFQPEAAYGSVVGVMVLGIKRGVFSNEAGIGSAPIAHSAAKTEEPVSEGIVALLEPFIDTVLVCMTTALVIVITGAHTNPANALIVENSQGAALTLWAFENGGFFWFKYVLFVAVILFAFSTCISWSYYGERCFVGLFGPRSSIVYKIIFLCFTFLGSVITATNVLDFSDLMILGMALPNLLGVFLLSGIVKRRLDVYWNDYRTGQLRKPSIDQPTENLSKN